ncbi:hypothetical protein RA210_U80010 [Rubrivivax sp. A210]|nr:hypothetical protein RA210_U80010 [Rubrivivax sp. A210]
MRDRPQGPSRSQRRWRSRCEEECFLGVSCEQMAAESGVPDGLQGPKARFARFV